MKQQRASRREKKKLAKEKKEAEHRHAVQALTQQRDILQVKVDEYKKKEKQLIAARNKVAREWLEKDEEERKRITNINALTNYIGGLAIDKELNSIILDTPAGELWFKPDDLSFALWDPSGVLSCLEEEKLNIKGDEFEGLQKYAAPFTAPTLEKVAADMDEWRSWWAEKRISGEDSRLSEIKEIFDTGAKVEKEFNDQH